MIPDRRALLVGAAALAAAGAARARASEDLDLSGRFVQGGHALGRTWPRALVFVDGEGRPRRPEGSVREPLVAAMAPA